MIIELNNYTAQKHSVTTKYVKFRRDPAHTEFKTQKFRITCYQNNFMFFI